MQKQRRSKKTSGKLKHEKSNLNKQILNSKFQLLTSNVGITLIALVVTIVVLLILAAITINLVLADDGIFGKAEDAGEEQRKAEILEMLNTAEATMSIEHLGKPGIREYLDYVYEKGIAVKEDEEVIEENKEYDIYTKDGYVFNIKIKLGNTTNDILINYKGTIESQPPKVKEIKVTKETTNSIDIEVTVSRLYEGEITYLYKKDGEPESSYKELKTTTDLKCSYTGLEAGTVYNIKVVATNKNGNDSLVTSGYTGQLATGTIEQDGPTIWNSEIGTAKIYLKTSETMPGITIQYQVGTELEWHNYTADGISNLKHNDIVQVRLFDGTNGSTGDASITIQDDVAPQPASITIETSNGTSIIIKATVTHNDNESGPNIESCKWIFNTKPDPLETDASKYTDGTFSSNGQEISKTVTGGSTYYLHILTIDRSGKAIETISEPITVNSAPAVPTVSVSSKTANSITVSATATDPDANNLTYQLYVGEELKATSDATASGTAVTLTANDLLEYQDYNYYVIVTDGALSNTGATQTVKTYCSGTNISCTPTYCAGGSSSECDRCDGEGTTSSSSDCGDCSDGRLKCSGCGGDGSMRITCRSCNGSGDYSEWITCTACGGTGDGDFYIGATDGYGCGTCGKKGGWTQSGNCRSCYGNGEESVTCSVCGGTNSWSECDSCNGKGSFTDYKTCGSCKGVGSSNNPCAHSLYSRHYHCTHSNNRDSATHYYCDHNTAGKQHE